MQTLILNGSPRPRGNTADLLAYLRARLPGEQMVLSAYDSQIASCVDCRHCWTHPGCAIHDDMDAVDAFLQGCDAVVIASPLYFSQLSGRLLDVASRLQRYFCARHFQGQEPIGKSKRGGVILVGGGDGTPTPAYRTACTLLHHMRCTEIHPPVVSLNTNQVPACARSHGVSFCGLCGEFPCEKLPQMIPLSHMRQLALAYHQTQGGSHAEGLRPDISATASDSAS